MWCLPGLPVTLPAVSRHPEVDSGPGRPVESSWGGQMNGQRELRLSTGAEGEAKDTGLALFPGLGTAPERQP